MSDRTSDRTCCMIVYNFIGLYTTSRIVFTFLIVYDFQDRMQTGGLYTMAQPGADAPGVRAISFKIARVSYPARVRAFL